MITRDQVTIIIPHLGETAEARSALSECATSLEETTSNIKKIYVINGMVGNEALKNQEFYVEFARRYKKESFIFLKEQGQCKAVSAAVATTNTPWLLITNDDMIYPPGWFEELGSCVNNIWFNQDQKDGIREELEILCLSPKLIEPRDGAPTFEKFFAGGAGGDFNKQKWLDFAKDYEKRPGLGIRTGFNLPFLIRRDLWDTIGGYDINYDPWGSNSDSDLEYKIRLAGVQPYQNTNCIVYHFSNTSGTFEPRNNSYWQKNFAYFEEKWGFPRTDNGIWEANFEMPAPPIRKFQPEWEGKYAK